MEAILISLLGGLCYRIRGGLLDDIIGREISNFYIRSAWATPVALVLAWQSQLWLAFPLIYCAALLGVSWGYLGEFSLDFPKNRNWKNYLLLSIDGMKVMLPAAALMSTLDFHQVWFAVFAGLVFAPAYLLGNVIYRFCKLQGPTQYGEWLLGMSIAAAL
jgi:hypothetical protein